jgi:glycogen(starch) synthase
VRICLLSQEFPPDSHFGGIGTYTYNVAAGLARRGHTVHVVASTRSSPSTRYEEGVWVHRIKHPRLRPDELSRLFYSIQVARKVVDAGCPFDIVQASEFRSEGYILARTHRFPLVTRLATPSYLTAQLNRKASFNRPLSNRMERSQTVRSNGIISSTKSLAKSVSESWRIDMSCIRIIPNTVDVARVVRLGTDSGVPATLADGDFAVYFGRLEERKGVHILARALPSVLERHRNTKMVFVGADAPYQGGSMRPYIRRMAANHQERILFLDNQPQEKLFPVVARAKLVVLPSLWEAFGFVCVEAMALGRPVLATSGSGFEEIIIDGESGHLLPPGNADLLSEAMIRILGDPEGRRRVGAAAAARAGDFELSRILPMLIDYYENVGG